MDPWENGSAVAAAGTGEGGPRPLREPMAPAGTGAPRRCGGGSGESIVPGQLDDPGDAPTSFNRMQGRGERREHTYRRVFIKFFDGAPPRPPAAAPM
ncbi:hypothetical protein GCM10009767_16240 [Kocuria aegyptia]|uniref:Uncharacterized protein n=1 Tax=Kocuria aegyptia TaxID=330943 RepID=A0ABP4WLT0_9MICC